jgi:pilus assembly protein CpaF
MAADLPVTSIHRQLVSAIDVIVHISRLPGGRRVVTQVAEVTRYDPEEKQVVVLDIFNYRNGVSLRPTGYLPSFIDSLVDKELLELEFLYGRDAEKPLLPPPPPAAELIGR